MLSNRVLSLFFALFALFCVDISSAKTLNNRQSYGNPAIFRKTILRAHNNYRNVHQADSVHWDRDAAAHALRHAQKCVFEHSSDSSYGENIAAGYLSSDKAVKDWYDEVGKYNYGNPGFSPETGHFSALVWKNTKGVGCAAAYCDGIMGSGKSWFLVCNYNAAGNVEGEYQQNVLPPNH